jgi:hypothetical protein
MRSKPARRRRLTRAFTRAVLCCLQEDANWEDWLAAVMRLLLGFPMRLQLPRDRYGQPDFMDACEWQGEMCSSVVWH